MSAPPLSQDFAEAFRPACSDGSDPGAWLKDRIRHYTNEASRLERELTHVKILLKGHQTWLADVERRKGGQR
ncbi:MAG: hypothetical protein HC875_40365 [Anaerolineales bacterium]|nr:hypothetical protein [Anaerolineales bacterium]